MFEEQENRFASIEKRLETLEKAAAETAVNNTINAAKKTAENVANRLDQPAKPWYKNWVNYAIVGALAAVGAGGYAYVNNSGEAAA